MVRTNVLDESGGSARSLCAGDPRDAATGRTSSRTRSMWKAARRPATTWCSGLTWMAPGNVTLDQQRAVVHPTNNPNEPKTLSAANLVTLGTITDKDGDSASGDAGTSART